MQLQMRFEKVTRLAQEQFQTALEEQKRSFLFLMSNIFLVFPPDCVMLFLNLPSSLTLGHIIVVLNPVVKFLGRADLA